MSTREQSTATGISSRRFACDRCRGSKAKCLRQNPDQPRCDRCTRTDSQCITTPVFRVRSWQPPDADTGYRDGRKLNKRQRRSERQDQFPTPTNSHSPPNPERTPADAMTPQQDANECSGSSVFNFADASVFADGLDGQVETIFTAHEENVFDLDLSEHLFRSITPAITGVDSSSSLPTQQPPSGELQGQFRALQFHSTCSTQTPHDMRVENSLGVSLEPTQTPMQQLSKLDYELITLTHRLDQGQPKLVMKMLTGEETSSSPSSPSAIDDLLRWTAAFADVIKLLADSALPPPIVPPSSSRLRSRQGSYDSIQTSRSSNYSGYESSAADVESPIDSPSSNLATLQELNMPSLLLVITAYTHLVNLYSIIFASVYEHLKEISRCDSPHLRPVTGLKVSGFPMGKEIISPTPMSTFSNP